MRNPDGWSCLAGPWGHRQGNSGRPGNQPLNWPRSHEVHFRLSARQRPEKKASIEQFSCKQRGERFTLPLVTSMGTVAPGVTPWHASEFSAAPSPPPGSSLRPPGRRARKSRANSSTNKAAPFRVFRSRRSTKRRASSRARSRRAPTGSSPWWPRRGRRGRNRPPWRTARCRCAGWRTPTRRR